MDPLTGILIILLLITLRFALPLGVILVVGRFTERITRY